MSSEIKPRVDEDGVVPDALYHADGTCCMECRYMDDQVFRLRFDGLHVNVRKCNLFGLPMAQSVHLCPVAARRNAALLRECRNLLAEVWIHPWTIDSSKEDDIRALLERIGE